MFSPKEIALLAIRDGNTSAQFRAAAQRHANATWYVLFAAVAIWYFAGWKWAMILVAFAAFKAIQSISATSVAVRLEKHEANVDRSATNGGVMMVPQIFAKEIFDRTWILFAYVTVTLLVCLQVMFTSSFVVGIAALMGSALCFFGAATFTASFLARGIKNYALKDLAGIGAIALVLCVAGIALTIWSGFWVTISGVYIEGWIWALIGIVSAILGTKKKHAL